MAIARQLAAAGTKVALVARRADQLQRIADEINRETGEERALPVPHDVSNWPEVPELFQTICKDLGGLDLLIYAAGEGEPIVHHVPSVDKTLYVNALELRGEPEEILAEVRAIADVVRYLYQQSARVEAA